MEPKTVLLRGSPAGREGIAGDVITPGMFLNVQSDGQVDPASAGEPSHWVAREAEDAAQGIDDVSPSGFIVRYWAAKAGDQFFALLANNENVAAGALLEVAAAGVLGAVDTGVAVARALEAVNNASGSPARIRVEIV